MKRISYFVICMALAIMTASCGKTNYKSFIGTWGVEKVEYYNIDYAGNPIESTIEVYNFVPGADDGIDLVFRADKTGVMCDKGVDTIPDRNFTYSYDADESILYLNMDYSFTYKMVIQDMTNNSFIYTNEYEENYVEKAYLKRTSKNPTRSSGNAKRPVKPGSFFGDR